MIYILELGVEQFGKDFVGEEFRLLVTRSG